MSKPLLVKKTLDDIDMFFAPDEDMPYDDLELSVFKMTFISRYLDNQDYNKIIEYNARERGLKGKAVLSAHGDDTGHMWMFDDTKNLHSVQKWINKYDGAYSVLMLYCCNPGHLPVKSKKSVLLLPNTNYNKNLHESGRVQVELFLPGYGYMDNYEIESYVDIITRRRTKE